jgi:hypothetical protein
LYFPDFPKTNQFLAQGTTRNVRDNNRKGRNTKIRTENEKEKDRKKRILEYCTYKRKAKKNHTSK